MIFLICRLRHKYYYIFRLNWGKKCLYVSFMRLIDKLTQPRYSATSNFFSNWHARKCWMSPKQWDVSMDKQFKLGATVQKGIEISIKSTVQRNRCLKRWLCGNFSHTVEQSMVDAPSPHGGSLNFAWHGTQQIIISM